MRAAIRITLNEPKREMVHQFQNFGEDVYRAMRDVASFDWDEIDRATSTFVAREIRRQDIGTATDALKRVIRRYRWEDVVSFARVDAEAP